MFLISNMIYLIFLFTLNYNSISQVGLCREQTLRKRQWQDVYLGNALGITIFERNTKKLGLDRRRSWIAIQSQQSYQLDP